MPDEFFANKIADIIYHNAIKAIPGKPCKLNLYSTYWIVMPL